MVILVIFLLLLVKILSFRWGLELLHLFYRINLEFQAWLLFYNIFFIIKDFVLLFNLFCDFFCSFLGALRPQTPGSTFPTVKLEKSREKSPLKKFFSHTFRLLIYLWKRRIVTSDSIGQLWHIYNRNFNAIWQMKNFSALLSRFLFIKRKGSRRLLSFCVLD